MSASLEEQKKAILPFMQRAQEMQKTDPKVAYYCRLYAVEQACRFEKRAADVTELVTVALDQMEKDKPHLDLDEENDRYICEALALKIFSNADKVDRAGKATLTTAKTFYASTYFFEILNHFGPLEEDLLEKQRYALWRAAGIRKAVLEGGSTAPPGSDLADKDTEGPDNAMLTHACADTIDTEASSMPFALHESLVASHRIPASQRFVAGSKVLYLGDGEGMQPELGTVGQATLGDCGQWRYRVALRDRLLDVRDDRLVPQGVEDYGKWSQGGETTAATPLLVNEVSRSDATLQSCISCSVGHEAHALPLCVRPRLCLVQQPNREEKTVNSSLPSYANVDTEGKPTYSMHEMTGFKPSIQAVLDAQKNAKYAISSLNFDDIPAAVKFLKAALNKLTSDDRS
ncbi:hypothetical protein CEUSTIGMA_g7646.t1 [Chlamydomonas eustigma]|uniref:Vta1/callose synthase N-terminal domain-containing protein n=1 Tax=Chlamydomonas eustigma TaxID=1157962 RepID=A0A250XAU8_9CHLO|nr:hypothetical protein CEUSTIGMA_g7646.t1 [Chlamydomonas eustigma]|eukprot:GAX80208.1 hypothetical protein CEUSTIGMA_g7646.t1 [Chlamydomonas eustigma]